MEPSPPCPLAPALAERIRAARTELTHRWLERITARVTLDPNLVFPSEQLLDHVPLLLDGIAAYLEDPAEEVVGHAGVVAKAMELGALRHEQGFDEYEILKEFEVLGGIVFNHLVREVRTLDEPCEKDELLVCGYRLFRAITLIQEASVAHYLQHMRGTLVEREQRLRGFNRALTHELKNHIGAVLGAARLLELESLTPAERAPLASIVSRNATAMHVVLDNLVELSRVDVDVRRQRRVLLPQAIAEAVRQLRDGAAAAGVQVRVKPLPEIEVPAAAVELAIANYVSNAIKYADPATRDRWVEVSSVLVEAGTRAVAEVTIEVRDNGRGVPAELRPQLFGRGFRAHAGSATDIEGTGMGLSIAKEAIEALGGRVWAAFPPEGGSCFALALPARRANDVQDYASPRPDSFASK